jgi:hypothetical protein
MEGECMRRLSLAQEMVLSIVCVLLGAGPAMSVDAKPTPPSENIVIPAGAEIMILTKTDLYSQTLIVGERLAFEVARDVIVDGRKVIAEGAPVEVVVTMATPRKSFGRRGKFGISAETVTAVDGQKIKLKGALNKQGDSRTDRTAILAIFGGPLLVVLNDDLHGGQSGVNARIKAGTEIKVVTAEEKSVSVDARQPPAQGQDKNQ